MILGTKFLQKHDVKFMSQYADLIKRITDWMEEMQIDYISYSGVGYGDRNAYGSMPLWLWKDWVVEFTSSDDEILFKLTWL